MADGMVPMCASCRRYKGGGKCEAYPNDIPYAIMVGGADHRLEQDGDHGLRYEPKEGAEATLRVYENFNRFIRASEAESDA